MFDLVPPGLTPLHLIVLDAWLARNVSDVSLASGTSLFAPWPAGQCSIPVQKPSALLHLHQCCLRLGQPEGHVHGPVEVDSGGQCGLRLLPLAGPGVEGAEAEVAMRLQGAHVEFLSQGEGLAVVGGGLVDVRRLATPSNLAEETEGMRLVAASDVG